MNEASDDEQEPDRAGRSRPASAIRCSGVRSSICSRNPGDGEGRLEHGGHHRARADGVDPEALGGEPLGERAHHPEHPGLRRAVGGQHRAPEEPLDRGDEDRPPTRARPPGTACSRCRQMTAAARRLTFKVASQMSSSRSSTVRGAGHPGGVDEPAERSERAGRRRPPRRDRRRVGHVDRSPRAPSPRTPGRSAAVSSAPGAVDVPQGDGPADLGQRDGGRPARSRSAPPVTRTPVPGAPSRRGGGGSGCGRESAWRSWEESSRRPGPAARDRLRAQVRRPR